MEAIIAPADGRFCASSQKGVRREKLMQEFVREFKPATIVAER